MPVGASRSMLVALLLGLVGAAAPARAASPPLRHVWVIVLENESFDTTFGVQSAAPYLSLALPSRGAFVPYYYGVTHNSLGNYLAMIGGRGPTLDIQADCPVFSPLRRGRGCVQPASVRTIADQLAASGRRWKAYMEDMAAPCEHPALGAVDTTQLARPGHQYAARHNPFVYFQSIVGSPACARNDLPLTALPAALRSARRTPALSFISPDLCNDGHDSPCVTGEPGGLVTADAWLRRWVPRILRSPAYRRDGLLVIAFDEAQVTDASACCDEPRFPDVPNNGFITRGRGGGRTGAVLLSPFIDPGTITTRAYNHFSLLRSIEDLFGLPHLGYAARRGLRPFGRDIFTCYSPGRPRARHGRLARGALIRRAVVARGAAPRPTLEVRLRRRARVTVTATTARRGARLHRIGRSTVAAACRPLDFALRSAHGRIRVTASLRGAREVRGLRF